jgi:dihydroorotate dehydrogenase (NAD+) catalytic subunit
MAGASAVQVGTAVFVQPNILMELIDQLPVWLESQGCASLDEIVGVANPRFKSRAIYPQSEAATA